MTELFRHLRRVSTGVYYRFHVCRVLTIVRSSPFVLSIESGTVFTICVKYQLGYNRYHLCRVSTGVQLTSFVSSIDWSTTATICVQYRLWYNRYHLCPVAFGVQQLPFVSSIDCDSYFHFIKSIFIFVLKKTQLYYGHHYRT